MTVTPTYPARLISLLLALSLVVVAVTHIPSSADARQMDPDVPHTGEATPPASPAATPVIGPLATPRSYASPIADEIVVPDTREQQLAEELLENEYGVYGFVVLEQDGTFVASIHSRTPFVTASLYKLLVMATIYSHIENGWLAEDDTITLQGWMFQDGGDNYFSPASIGSAITITELIFAMGAYSSNVAARSLLTLTSPTELRNTAFVIGMTDTYLFVDPRTQLHWPPQPAPDAPADEVEVAREYLEGQAQEGPVNLTTPLDMARYQLAIVNDTLISPWVSEQVANVLLRQAIRDRIPALLDGSVTTLNKPGNLLEAVNDVGVIFLPNGPRAVAILAEAVPNDEWATQVEQRLAYIATGWASTGQPIAWIREES